MLANCDYHLSLHEHIIKEQDTDLSTGQCLAGAIVRSEF